MVSRYSAYRRGDDTISPDVIDRILIGACAAIWLVLLGVSVAATVALADLGRGFHKAASNTHSTSWVLYAVIIVSALIIAGAIPMLIRARRMAQTDPAARGMTAPSRPPVRLMSQAPRTAAERARQPRPQAPAPAGDSDWSGETVDRVWLRGTVLLVTALGGALVAVATATYLMAVGHDGPSWAAYAVAGVVTAGMPAIEWLHVRQLRRVVDGG
ncbi:hypothetical protein A9X03_17475 [Mycobacterium sp. E1715]|uniref:DUF2561 family protein n=1 Tax=unclassified Mycobacterium TaxID=2642494 RepID=UPI0007FBAE8B|nr:MULTISPECIES: DUF2561 family protein [unclassified Mycobacterium]OBG58838.1 hypothetical protein A5703_02710 [Mycobacterium sp. E188]OBH20549.1 hypothetical protein A9X03_17475 [Mycobacterium sp. E1715]OBH37215.1 hypothetical protein A5691_26610 [Mycobacterium sp. E183]